MDKRVILSLSLLLLGVMALVLVSAGTYYCSDTDGGQNYNAKGTTSIWWISPQETYGPFSLNEGDGSIFKVISSNTVTFFHISPSVSELNIQLNTPVSTSIKINDDAVTTVTTVSQINFYSLGNSNNSIVYSTVFLQHNSTVSSGSDQCINSTTLNEQYCISSSMVSDNFWDITNGTYYTCSYGCSKGACNSAPTQQCTEDWSCTSWGSCTNSHQTRYCSDANTCGTTINKPATSRDCSSCTENWSCTDWSACSISGLHGRDCTDQNDCQTYQYRPALVQNCIPPTPKINNQEVTIENKTVTTNGISATTNLNVSENLSKVYVSTPYGDIELKISPSDAKNAAEEYGILVKAIEIDNDGGQVVYVAIGQKGVKLLGILPVSATIQQTINAQTGEIVSVKNPWWAFLAAGF